MKPPLSHLRLMKHIISGYIDDLYLQGSAYQKCAINIIDSIQMLDKLGLVIHPEKSLFIPQQGIVFLGFVIDSVKMTVTLTEDKILKTLQLLNFPLVMLALSGFGTLLELLGIWSLVYQLCNMEHSTIGILRWIKYRPLIFLRVILKLI